MTTRVKIIFPAEQPGVPTWPYVDYDVGKRTKEITAELSKALPGFEFDPETFDSVDEARTALTRDMPGADGCLVYLTALWTGIPEMAVQEFRPVIVADELYSGSGSLLETHSLVRQKGLPVVTVASSDFKDVVRAVRLFEVRRKIEESRVLMIINSPNWGSLRSIQENANAVFGVRLETMTSSELADYYQKADASEAGKLRDAWSSEALRIAEPSADELLKSARMHLALKRAAADRGCDAVTVDCLGLFASGELDAYPCMSHFQFMNEGRVGVCEADVNSVISSLIFKHLAGRPGFVSDPVIDTAANRIILAHCVASSKCFGPGEEDNPYIIRSHAEDRKGASVQSIMPTDETVTTIKVSASARALAVHTGRAVDNVDDESACRTKLAVEAPARKILDNWHFEKFAWHRVTCYGDWREDVINLARLYGLEIIEEDRG